MSKKVYISERQLQIIENHIKEDVQTAGPVEIPLLKTPGETTVNAFKNKAKELQKAGANPKNFEFTVPVTAVTTGVINSGKVYTKKEIQEAKIQKYVGNGTVYTKKDFTNTILNK